jgi:hypothetical protein
MYDLKSARWSVTILRDGKSITLHPAHMVFVARIMSTHHAFCSSDPTFGAFPKRENVRWEEHCCGGTGNLAVDIFQDLVV